ncbi:TPA: acyltransferase family protein [Pseudomonas aeruginosa]
MSSGSSKLLNGMVAVSSGRNIRLDVQGLRAVAVLAVLAYHANSAWLRAGFVGVDVFFVISGFIITALLVERGVKVDLVEFYAGRIKRIFPAYFVMLAIVCIASTILFLPDDYVFFEKSLQSSVFFSSNHYFANFGSYFAPRAEELPLLHTWSLAIEMQFYLFYPVLFMCLPCRWRLPVFILLAILLFIWSGYCVFSGSQDAQYFALLARVPEFMSGAVVALSLRDRELPARLAILAGLLGAALLVCSFIIIDKQHFPGFWSLLPCLGAALLIAARRGPASLLLASRPMVWIGGISYSLYLWHWPILAFIRYYTGQYELSFVALLAFLTGSFLLAWFSYRYIETPARKAVGLRQQALKWMLAASVVAIVVTGGAQFNVLVVAPAPIQLTRYAAPESICHGVQVGECKRGSVNAVPRVLVIGDSHAAQLNYFFDVVGNESGVAYRVLTGSSCVPIPAFDLERLPRWARKPCQAQIDAVAQSMLNFDKIIVAGMWQYQMQSPAFAQAMRAFLVDTSYAGKQVVLLGQIPMFESNVQRVRRFRELGLSAPLVSSSWQGANQLLRALAEGIPNVRFMDFSTSAFFADAPYQDGELIYQDSHHLNEVGARRYGYFASRQLQRLFEQPQSSVSLKP